MDPPESTNAAWHTSCLVTICVASTGAFARVVVLSLAGAMPTGVVEAVEQAWVGTVWLSVVGGAGLLLFSGSSHTVLWGLIWSLINSTWDVLIEWPLSAVFGVVIPYYVSAIVLPVLGVAVAFAKWNLTDRLALNVKGSFSRLGAVAAMLLIIWLAGVGSRWSATSVIRSMDATSVRSARISGLFSFGMTWRAVWVEFGATGHGPLEYRKLITELRKITSSDYRLTFHRAAAPTMSRQDFMIRLAWCGAQVNIRS